MRDRPQLDLFLISWLILFIELTCIRWFPSHVMFLTFFTNIVLLASFVGMSVGCLAARSSKRYLDQTPTWLAFAVALGLIAENSRFTLMKYLAIGDRSNPDVIFFGAEAGDTFSTAFRVPVEFIAGAFFVLIAIVLIGPGQQMGRAFTAVPSRARAYSINLLGSLVGIATFGLCSLLWLPPIVWFSAIAIGLGYFVFRSNPDQSLNRKVNFAMLGLVVILSLASSGIVSIRGKETTWSPYYRIDFFNQASLIETNLVSHQIFEPRDVLPHAKFANYAIPYLLQRDLREPDENSKQLWSTFRRVLIIGAGSGNDVSRALQWLPDDARIDAVEIDPVIFSIGQHHHPDHPYQDPRVHVVLNDGRNFLHKAESGTYDLVIFALVDSLVLHSGYSNLRLESYLFTEEAFRDAKRVLKPSGICAIYNIFRHGWLVARIRAELQRVFEEDPAVFVLTDKDSNQVKLDSSDLAAFTVFIAGSEKTIGPLRRKFSQNQNTYWIPSNLAPNPSSDVTPGIFGKSKPPTPGDSSELKWIPLRIAEVDSIGSLPLASDDWPFLYVREPGIPLVTWRGMAMMLGLSLLIWFLYRYRETSLDDKTPRDLGLAMRCFFLGAGFMLVETKAVVQMALLFGSTWIVNSIVFAAILLMSLLGVLYVSRFSPRRLEIYYVGLFLTLILGVAISLNSFLGLDPTLQIVSSCILVFAPIAFAGVIFATSFSRSSRPDRVFGANVAGALLGGLAENASVLIGFQYLLIVAGGFYLLSALFGSRSSTT